VLASTCARYAGFLPLCGVKNVHKNTKTPKEKENEKTQNIEFSSRQPFFRNDGTKRKTMMT
jgi:hypothetical protein